MRTEDFDYELPEELIAQQPVEPRDSARLLVDGGPGERPTHRQVCELPDLLLPGDLLVVNDSRVIPARLALHRGSGGAAEVLLLEALGDEQWEAMARPARKLKQGEVLYGPGDVPVVEIGERTPAGDTFVVRLLDHDAAARFGAMPLPPYITAPLTDADRYQTVYSREPGSAAAPTAGLHFTPELLQALAAKGIGLARVELMVGLDTFKPIATDDPADHVIHTERYRVPPETLSACSTATRVVAVGTTAVRALETAAATGAPSGRSSLFIRRPYDWRVVDVLLTNFHLPRTTLLCMIDAFVGPRWRELYAEAVTERYRFLSFGDAMLLTRSETA